MQDSCIWINGGVLRKNKKKALGSNHNKTWTIHILMSKIWTSGNKCMPMIPIIVFFRIQAKSWQILQENETTKCRLCRVNEKWAVEWKCGNIDANLSVWLKSLLTSEGFFGWGSGGVAPHILCHYPEFFKTPKYSLKILFFFKKISDYTCSRRNISHKIFKWRQVQVENL